MLRNQYEMRAAADLKMKIQLISRLTGRKETRVEGGGGERKRLHATRLNERTFFFQSTR